MFNAIYFTYDGVYSGDYGLYIASIDGEYVQTTSVYAPTLNIAKGIKSKKFFYSGIDYEDAPEYQFSLMSQTEIPDIARRDILSWLVGRKGFKRLYMHQKEYFGIYYNCIFTTVDIIYVGGKCHGFTLTAKFDSPYCYGEPTQKKITLAKGVSQTIAFHNESDVLDDYVYPTLTFSKDISIVNQSDGSRVTSYSGVETDKGEIITIDNELKIVDSTVGGDKLSNFNLNWLRFKKGINKLVISGEGEVTISCPKYILLGF